MRFPTKFLTLLAGAVLATSGLHSSPAKAADCGEAGRITIAEMSWLSAAIEARVLHRILTEGYGCDAELQPGDTVPTATSMLQKSEPTIAPELWVSTAADIWAKIQDKGNVYKATDIFTEGGKEGWWIPDYVAEENPGLKSVHDLPEYADLFTEAATGGKARLYGCPPGWGCEVITNNLYNALELADQGFESAPFSPGSGANLKASIARKVTREQPIVAYYWGPTAVIGRYDLVRLDIPEGYQADTFRCLTDKNCENPAVSDWPPGEVAVAVVKDLRDEAPDVAEMLSKMQYPNDVINRLLAWADEGSQEPEAAAERFLKQHEDVWTSWVPADVAERVKASL
jgi:glycine betaine/proline transport system substrate-binding protein